MYYVYLSDIRLCTVVIINFFFRDFSHVFQILADISGSQQPSSFLSLAFPWLDIYPPFHWLKQKKYAVPTYPLFSLSLSIKKTLPLGLPRKCSKALKHLA